MVVVGGKTVEVWVLLVIAIMGWVLMVVVGREHAGHRQEGLTTQRVRRLRALWMCRWQVEQTMRVVSQRVEFEQMEHVNLEFSSMSPA